MVERRRPAQRRSVTTMVLLPIIGAVLLPVLVDVATEQLPEVLDGYLWLSWPLAAVLAGIVAAAEIRRARRARTPVARRVHLDRAADELADAVASQWRAEAAMRALNQPLPIRLGWRLTEREVSARPSAILTTRPGDAEPAPLPTAGFIDDVVETLIALPHRQMVVRPARSRQERVGSGAHTGPAGTPRPDRTGAGAAQSLRLGPARRAPRRLAGPPAGRGVSGTGELRAVRGSVAAALVDRDRVVPVLDGLDELPDELHAGAILAVNEAVAGGRPLVLTCRAQEYQAAVEAAGVVLANAFVLELRPVEPQAALDYLASTGPGGDRRWRAVSDHVLADPQGPLAEALSTPLMIWLARVIYRSPAVDPAELIGLAAAGGRAVIEDHLLDNLLPAVYQPRPAAPVAAPLRPYPAGVVLAGLAAAAVLVLGVLLAVPFGTVPALRPAAVLAAIGLATTVPAGCLAIGLAGPPAAPARFALRRPAGRAGGFAIGVGFAAGGFAGLLSAPVLGVAVGAGLLLVGVATGGYISMFGRPDLVSASSPLAIYRGDRATLVALCAGGLLMGTASGLLVGTVPTDLPHWLLNGLANALLYALAGYAVARAHNPQPWRLRLEVGAAAAGGVLGAGLGVAVGLLVSGEVGGLTPMLVGSLAAGLGLGFVAGLALTAAGWFTLARGYLAIRGRLPWRLLEFLQDAQRRGVLRQVGGVYQFRHARLQDRLAGPDISERGTVLAPAQRAGH